MALEFRRAERKKAKLRIGVFGPTGSGKTMSALLVAHGFAPWEKICIIDTENGSADLYSHLGPYNIVTIRPPYAPEFYIDAIRMAEQQGMEVIVIDSITHEWQGTGGMLEIADSLAPSMRDGRMIWTKITPRHNKFIDAILQSPAHVICCGRSKTDTIMVETERNGRKTTVPEQVGLKAITREGFDYEMTVSFDVAKNHYATCSKDRTKGDDNRALFQDKSPRILDEEVGRMLKAWSESGKADVAALKSEAVTELKRLGFEFPADRNDAPAFIRDVIQKVTGLDPRQDANFEAIVAALKAADPAASRAKFFGDGGERVIGVGVDVPPAGDGGGAVVVSYAAIKGVTPDPAAPEPLIIKPRTPSAEQTEKIIEAFGGEIVEPGQSAPARELTGLIDWKKEAIACTDPLEATLMLEAMQKSGESAMMVGIVRGLLNSKGLV